MEQKTNSKPMTKNELLAKIAEILEIDKKTVRDVIDTYENMLLLEFDEFKEVKVGIFGKIKISERIERQGVNPSTGEKVIIPARAVPKFTFSKGMKEIVLHNFKK